MKDADIIEKYLLAIDLNADKFSIVELQLFKLTGHAASRRMIFREAFIQDLILRFEYNCLIEWENKFDNGDYGTLIRAQRHYQKNSGDDEDQSQSVQMKWDKIKRKRRTPSIG
jgi:hypothetical protein